MNQSDYIDIVKNKIIPFFVANRGTRLANNFDQSDCEFCIFGTIVDGIQSKELIIPKLSETILTDEDYDDHFTSVSDFFEEMDQQNSINICEIAGNNRFYPREYFTEEDMAALHVEIVDADDRPRFGVHDAIHEGRYGYEYAIAILCRLVGITYASTKVPVKPAKPQKRPGANHRIIKEIDVSVANSAARLAKRDDEVNKLRAKLDAAIAKKAEEQGKYDALVQGRDLLMGRLD